MSRRSVMQDLGLCSLKKFSVIPQESLTLENEKILFQYLAACVDNAFLWLVFKCKECLENKTGSGGLWDLSGYLEVQYNTH